MNRTLANAVVDSIAGVLFLGMMATGYLLRFPLPPGTNKLYTLWGLTRHQWGTVHSWISAGLLATILIHVIIHWQWIVSVIGRRLRLVKSSHPPLLQSGLVVLLVVAGAFGLFALAAHWSVREIEPRITPPTSNRVPSSATTVDALPDDASTRDEGPSTTAAASGAEIQLLFEERCVRCHGQDRQLAGFRIDQRDDLFGNGDKPAWILPGNVEASPLIEIVSGSRPEMRMARQHTLSEEQLSRVRAWIAAGAPWPVASDEGE